MPKRSAKDVIAEHDENTGRLKIRNKTLEVKQLKREVKDLIELLAVSEARADIMEEMAAADSPKPIVRREKKSKLREATGVLLASDWHVGEQVISARVNGTNEYTPAIARRRVERMARGFVEHIGNLPRYKIRDVILCIMGDIITGWLHQDQLVTNYLTPIEEVLHAEELCVLLIDYILANCKDLTRLHIPCNYGNHGRTTFRTLHSAQAETSYEFLIYSHLVRHYRDDKRVSFDLCAGKFVFTEVYDQVLRGSHGDDVRYGGGVGGITIPINKAIPKWDRVRRADIDVMGHFHTYINLPHLMVNSSLIGPSSYGLTFGIEAPSQGCFLIEPGYGKDLEHRIRVENAA